MTTATPPPKTVEMVRKLVEEDKVLFVFKTLGTPPNTAIHKYMNGKKVPQLFVATGASKWGNPKEFPWTMGWQPDYATEGAIYAKHILANVKDAKIGVLMQNDDYGKDYFNGFKAGLGKDADKIVAGRDLRGDRPDRRQPDDPAQELRRQRVLQHHDAEVRGPGHQEGGRDRLEAGALSQQRVGLGRRGDQAGRLRRLAGHHHGPVPQGPHRPAVGERRRTWSRGTSSWTSTAPTATKPSTFHVYGYSVTSTDGEVLKRCGDDLTRANVMKQAANLKGVEMPMLLPGIKVNTSPTDFYPIQSVQLSRFKGETWELFGDILSNESREPVRSTFRERAAGSRSRRPSSPSGVQ